MIRQAARIVWAFALLIASLVPACAGQTIRLGIEGRGESFQRYEVSVLELALAHSGEEVTLDIVHLGDIAQGRTLVEFENGRANFDVFYSGGSKEREGRFRQIDIPLSRGLLGHRIFITHKEKLPDLNAIKTLGELRDFAVIACGIGWPDSAILQRAGFKVAVAEWDALWKMVDAGRVNAFSRGLHEALPDLKGVKEDYPDLVVDGNILLSYKYDFFFYVHERDNALAELIRRGLNTAYENGAFMEHFYGHPDIRAAIAHIEHSKPRRFQIDNPLLSARQRAIPDRYWHTF
ncbi:hypothetical protein JM93_01137 [Roseibium hamelinense]|uniref:Extracellular solute-binding protein (Family 3) n=1 Tax=Roseibium hamelinense TaxID=150831 RepID=A0A562TBI0_9HYPH|nr:hypothetical protein [Roseibium hamelinense]MTI45466.1 hypothetical protein [Roseibium hamelinense]TWI90160.1 hypothetical protein JM93_01137 [Roseibium hamelinense]